MRDNHEISEKRRSRLYEAKSSGATPGNIRPRSPPLHAAAQALETELRDAASLDQLSLNFQPIVNFNSNRAIGFETCALTTRVWARCRLAISFPCEQSA